MNKKKRRPLNIILTGNLPSHTLFAFGVLLETLSTSTSFLLDSLGLVTTPLPFRPVCSAPDVSTWCSGENGPQCHVTRPGVSTVDEPLLLPLKLPDLKFLPDCCPANDEEKEKKQLKILTILTINTYRDIGTKTSNFGHHIIQILNGTVMKYHILVDCQELYFPQGIVF